MISRSLTLSSFQDLRARPSAVALVVLVSLTPLWWVHLFQAPGVELTLGRLALIVGGGLVISDVVRFRRSLSVPPLSAVALGGAALALGGWMIVNASIWGCQCSADIDGYVELASVLLYTLALLLIDSRWATPMLFAGGAAMFLAAALALVGVQGLEPGAIDLSATQGRLAGTYGNANYLGMAIAGGVPILVAFHPRRVSGGAGTTLMGVAWISAAAVICTAAVLSYSRSALIAAAAGGLVALVLGVVSPRRRVLVGASGLAALVGVGAIAYPAVEGQRRSVSLPALPDRMYRFVDASGWDGRAQGLIPRGPASFRNSPDRTSIIVTPGVAGEGISFPWGRAHRGVAYRLRFDARGIGRPSMLAFGMEDNQRGADPRSATAPVTTRSRTFELVWRPTASSANAQLYVWQLERRSPFELRNVRVVSSPRGILRTRQIDMRLRGTQYDEIVASYRLAEKKGEESRLTGLRLGFRAFRSQPIRGIGWQRFPDYAARNSTFGQLSSHNDYVRFGAELGLPGLLALLALLAPVVLRVVRAGRSRTLRAAAGIVVTGGIGLAFLNGLEAPAVSIPFAVAAALLCAIGRADQSRPIDPDHEERGGPRDTPVLYESGQRRRRQVGAPRT